MVVVALAGATTGFGLTMLHTFLHLNQDNRHKIVLLSRSAHPTYAARGVDVRPVDYTNHAELVRALSGVDTLLSTIGGSLEGLLNAQLALIAAAKEAGVRRWAPSEYAGSTYEGVDLYAPKATVWEATTKSGLEYTRFSCGLFMSLLATGTTKPLTAIGEREGLKTGEEEALSGLRPWNFVFNMLGGTADLPGDGTASLVWTDMRDIAHFVFRALDLPTWPEECSMRGDVKSYRDLIPVVERVQGRKMLIHENSIESLEEGAKNPSLTFYNQARIYIAKSHVMIGDELNRAFPDIKPVTCDEFLKKWWSGVEVGEAAWGEDQAFGKRDMERANESK